MPPACDKNCEVHHILISQLANVTGFRTMPEDGLTLTRNVQGRGQTLWQTGPSRYWDALVSFLSFRTFLSCTSTQTLLCSAFHH